MLRLAIQEDMLPGRTLLERFQHAQRLGLQGIELWAGDLDAHMADIITAVEQTGVVVAAINHGHRDGILRVNPVEREHALADLRQSICDAADLGAAGVVFVPHFGPPSIPDLTPFMSAAALEAELLLAHLRTLEDYAAAMGISLFIRVISHDHSHFLNHMEQASSIARKRSHPAIRIAASSYDLFVEESDVRAALHVHGDMLGYFYLADTERALPGQGSLDFVAVAETLRAVSYEGWFTLECGQPGANQGHAAQFLNDLPAALRILRSLGLA